MCKIPVYMGGIMYQGQDVVVVERQGAADLLNTYFLDEDGMENVDISEMLPAKLGWNKAFVSDEVIRGYTGELQDFMEALAYGRAPASDFQLAYETSKVMYAAYQSAEEGRRIQF